MADDTSASTASTTRTATSLLVATKPPSRRPSPSRPSRRRFSPSRRLAQEEKKIESTRQGQLRALERL
jgi:hypothetical protein